MTNAGGAGVLAADACYDVGLDLAPLAEQTRQRLAGLLPAGAVTANPVDTTAAVSPTSSCKCLEEVAADEGVDAVLVVTVPTAVGDPGEAVTAASSLKPMCAVVLDQAADVRLLGREAGAGAGARH